MPSSSERELFWRNLIARRQKLRLTVAEVCGQAGVSTVAFYQWQRRFRETDQRGSAQPLVPVRLVDDSLGELTLELPHGVRLRLPRIGDGPSLERLLRVALTVCRELESC